MDILHSVTVANMDFASDAQIFGATYPPTNVISDLLYAQLVVEAKWLGEFPLIALPMRKPVEHPIHLFEDVYAIHCDEWEIIDDSEFMLLNRRMLMLCETSNRILPDLKHCTSDEIRKLFKKEIFCRSGSGNV